MIRILTVSAALLLCSFSGFSSHSHRRSKAHTGQAGVFDFYVLNLSWSPEFCHGRPGAAECSQHKGFLVHGLWPQNNNGTYPSSCETSQPPPTNPSSLSDIMPVEILDHEWQQHGTCSGLSGDAYFALIRKAYDSIHIPGQFLTPASSFTTSPQHLKQAFEQANPNLSTSDLAIQLRGNYLNAVEICLTKGQSPSPIACSNLRDVSSGTFIVPPPR